MANIGFFDAETVDTNVKNGDFEAIPPGRYPMMISNSDVREVKGEPHKKYIWLEHTVLEGEYKDRKLFNNLHLWNPSDKAVKMAEGFFGQLCKACGKNKIGDTAELHSIPFWAEVGVDTKNVQPGKDPQNKIVEYFFGNEGAAPTTQPNQAAYQAPAQQGFAGVQGKAGGAPWRNG